jgi:hypothetical protein
VLEVKAGGLDVHENPLVLSNSLGCVLNGDELLKRTKTWKELPTTLSSTSFSSVAAAAAPVVPNSGGSSSSSSSSSSATIYRGKGSGKAATKIEDPTEKFNREKREKGQTKQKKKTAAASGNGSGGGGAAADGGGDSGGGDSGGCYEDVGDSSVWRPLRSFELQEGLPPASLKVR